MMMTRWARHLLSPAAWRSRGRRVQVLLEKKRSVLQSACDKLIDKDRQIAGCSRPELDESFSDRGLVDSQSPSLGQPSNHTYSARCRMV
jgi:hypothetical protein